MSDAAALDRVRRLLGPLAQPDAPLGARTTYRVGGPAAVLVEATSLQDLLAVHHALADVHEPVPFIVVGQGSNLLVADQGFPGVAVVLGGELGWVGIPTGADERASGSIGRCGAGSDGGGSDASGRCGTGSDGAGPDGAAVLVRAGGAARLPVVARQSASAGLRGLEWAVGVPGSVGGAVRMNAGGHGADMAAVLHRCTTLDMATGRLEERTPDELALGYRSSALGPGEVVVAADLLARRGSRDEAQRAVADIVRWRRQHQPGGANAGSVFTNPPGDAAGRLVERAGLKGRRLGTAQVSAKHANFIQADAGGRAADVRALIELVITEVQQCSGVTLVPEVRLVGFPDQPLPEVVGVA